MIQFDLFSLGCVLFEFFTNISFAKIAYEYNEYESEMTKS